jgi:DNA-binding XRE family transcriptional regulator
MTEKELQEIFSGNLKKFRARLNVTQMGLAKKIGVSTNFLNDLEAKKKWASPATMVKIAGVFNIQVYELFKPPGMVPDNLKNVIKEYTENIHTALENTQIAFLQDKKANRRQDGH